MPAILTTSPLDDRGFTLVEMLMATLVMTVGLLGLLQSVQMAYEHSLRNRVREEAVLLAEETMHDWRRVAFDDITAEGPKQKQVTRLLGGAPRSYTVTIGMVEMGSSTIAKPAKKLTVGVAWTVKGEVASHEIYTMRLRRHNE